MAPPFSQPPDIELLEEYLRPRIDTGKSPSPLFHDADIYSLHPEDLTSEYAPVTSRDGATRWYFFSPIRKKTGRDRRARRVVASCGCWHGEHREKAVLAGLGGPQVGYQKTFSFGRKENGKLLRMGWIMSELGFADGGGGMVLCKLYRSPKNIEGSLGPKNFGADAGSPTSPEGARGAKESGTNNVYKICKSPRAAPAPAPGTNNVAGDATRGSPTAAEGPDNIAGDAPPLASTRSSPRAAGGSRGATKSAVAASPRTAQGATESGVAGGARAAEASRGTTESAVAATPRTARAPSESAVASGARTPAEEQRSGSASALAASVGCSCRQDRRATKASRMEWVVAQVEVSDGEASPDELLIHKVCDIEWIRPPEGCSRKRNREGMTGWLVLGPASAAASVPEASSSPISS